MPAILLVDERRRSVGSDAFWHADRSSFAVAIASATEANPVRANSQVGDRRRHHHGARRAAASVERVTPAATHMAGDGLVVVVDRAAATPARCGREIEAGVEPTSAAHPSA